MKQDYYQKENLPEPTLPQCVIEKKLEGQKAIVTGASSGIGKAIALALGASGATVVVNYIGNQRDAEEVAHQISRNGSQAYIHRADVSNENDVMDMFRRTIDICGTIDILVNNAGIQADASFEQLSLKQWERVIGVNLTGQFLCAREAVREFKKRGVKPNVSCSAGKIICISSVHEIIPWAGHVNYAASKAGVMMLMKSIAQEVAPYRIRANSIAPGAIRTSINEVVWTDPEQYRKLMQLIPYRRIGTTDEIGHAAVWLASDDSDYINGITLFIDGGMTLYPGFETGG